MRKPYENAQRYSTRTGSGGKKGNQNGKFVACLGSFERPAMIQTTETRTRGTCSVCGKWCVLRDANIPRHKELAHVVQDWQVH